MSIRFGTYVYISNQHKDLVKPIQKALKETQTKYRTRNEGGQIKLETPVHTNDLDARLNETNAIISVFTQIPRQDDARYRALNALLTKMRTEHINDSFTDAAPDQREVSKRGKHLIYRIG